jgi:putative transposase
LKEKRKCIDLKSNSLSIAKRCKLIGLSRSSYYYEEEPIKSHDLWLMNRVDEIYTEYPFYGSRRITEELRRDGYQVNRKRIQRVMQSLGLVGQQPGPHTSKPHPEHKIFPYLLRGKEISKPLEVWSTDITYVRLQQGFVYLVAVMDWYSRLVLSHKLSNSLETGFCIEALKDALEEHGHPEIFNTDQGAQFTSQEFIDAVTENGMCFSMDGRGRAVDNIFVERLWRSLKYEDIYLRDYQTVSEARVGIEKYFNFYNTKRLHQSLGYKTPFEVHNASSK